MQRFNILTRSAARNVIKQQMRDAGIRLTLVSIREINEKAYAYLADHPELYTQALERALRMGWVEQHSDPPRDANGVVQG